MLKKIVFRCRRWIASKKRSCGSRRISVIVAPRRCASLITRTACADWFSTMNIHELPVNAYGPKVIIRLGKPGADTPS